MSDATSHRAATPWLDDGDVQLYHGDVIATLQGLPGGIAQTCVTSPPYWGLRDYGEPYQIGLEPTPEFYVNTLVCVFREVRRVLRDDGTVWLNLGDSYATGTVRNDTDDANLARRAAAFGTGTGAGTGPRSFSSMTHPTKLKDLVGVPWRVAFALQADGWYLRSDIVWSKPNPMPESVTDRPTKAHEYLFLLSKRPRYFYDADAIREPHDPHWLGAWRKHPKRPLDANPTSPVRTHSNGSTGGGMGYPQGGRNRRSVWTIATEPSPEAHFATYPQELVRPCILAGTSEHGECSACGAPWMRNVEKERRTAAETIETTAGWRPSCQCRHEHPHIPDYYRPYPTRPQTVLDPFIGSGTTALVARNHGRRCIGIDLNESYLEIAAGRTNQLSLLAAEEAS